MIQLSLFSFLALLEVIAVLLVLLGILVWRLRRMRIERRIQFIDATEEHPTASLYLDSEAAKTRTFVESLGAQPQAEPSAPALRAALGLRAGLLRQESVLAGKGADAGAVTRDSAAWEALARQIDATLKTEGFSQQRQQSHEIHGEDTVASEAIVAQQTRTIQHLRGYIQQLLEKLGHQPLPDNTIQERFDELERANSELSQCVAVLEDENSFLRDQIAELLRLDRAAGSTPAATSGA